MECGPENCPLGVTLSPAERKAQCEQTAGKLYKQGFTEEQIAVAMGVTQQMVSKYLRNFDGLQPGCKPHRPKGGRPKGTGKVPKLKPTGPQKHRRIDQPEAACLVLDEGLTYEQAAERCDVSLQVVRTSVQREEGRREGRADPEIALDDIKSMSERKKAEAAIRQYQRKLDAEFESRVLAECNRRLDQFSLPAYVKEMAKLEHSITSRKGIMTKEIFMLILRCLHPDKSASIDKHNKAFHEFNSLEKRLLNEKESPTIFRPMPKSAAEMMAMRKSKAKKPSVHSDKKNLAV
jgi:transposase